MPFPFSVREAKISDAGLLSDLLENAHRRHLHSDWFQPAELLGSRPFKFAVLHGSLAGCLGCPPDPPSVAWLRVFSSAHGYPPSAIWDCLWPLAEAEAMAMGIRQAAVMLIGDWIQPLLMRSGFEPTNEVIFLEWLDLLPPDAKTAAGQIRKMRKDDLTTVALVDQAAFPALWQHSIGTLREALRQAAYASVAIVDRKVVGYQITTTSPLGAHLARLAVHPSGQGHGVGKQLVVDSIRTLLRKGINRLTVNTQIDNHISRQLYASLGFYETGLNYPVFERHLG
jgi:ribosomal protein S18 acetylase RimI-like enzyme